MKTPRAVLAVLAAVVAGAVAAMSSVVQADAYTPRAGSSFNVPATAPGTSRARQMVFTDKVVEAVRATPRGETITVSMYSLSVGKVTDAFIAAHERGVRVRFISHTGATKNGNVRRLKAALGTNTRARSYVKICSGSCLVTKKGVGVQHAKVLTFSRVVDDRKKSVRWLTLVSSGNLTYAAGEDQWNEFQTIPGDRKIYDAATAYVASMRLDRDTFNTASVTSGIYRLDFLPQKKLTFDPVLRDLRRVTCTGGGTVRVAMYGWTGYRKAIARRLVSLHEAGCDVRVALDSRYAVPAVRKILTSGRVRTYDTRNTPRRYVHWKTTVIDARINGIKRHRVYAGSANFTGAAILSNTDVILRIDSAAETKVHRQHFDLVVRGGRRI
jgi:hypothetical protein